VYTQGPPNLSWCPWGVVVSEDRYEWRLALAALAAAFFIWFVTPPRDTEPNPNQHPGERVFQQYCAGCHTRGTSSCPRLEGLADRPTIARGLVNTPDNLRLWIQNPRAIRAGTSMPTLPLTDQQMDDLLDWMLSTY